MDNIHRRDSNVETYLHKLVKRENEKRYLLSLLLLRRFQATRLFLSFFSPHFSLENQNDKISLLQ